MRGQGGEGRLRAWGGIENVRGKRGSSEEYMVVHMQPLLKKRHCQVVFHRVVHKHGGGDTKHAESWPTKMQSPGTSSLVAGHLQANGE